jgi:lactose/cellobiose-specific phosphotransferase system IIC component
LSNDSSALTREIYSQVKTIFNTRVSPSLHALREGMLWLLPCLTVSAFILFAASLSEFILGKRTDSINTLFAAHDHIASFFPYLLTSAIAYIFAMRWRLARPPIALLSIVYMLMVEQLVPSKDFLLTFKIVIAIVGPVYIAPLLAYFIAKKWTRLVNTDSAGTLVKESLNMIVPAFIVGFIVLLVNAALFTMIAETRMVFGSGLDYANESYGFGVLFAALNSSLWFLGIHGYYALLPMVEYLQEANLLNYAVVSAGGDGVYHMNLSFMGAFVFIGGSGATLSLIAAILILSKNSIHRVIAVASIPIAFMNINEVLLFGLPIILNPRLFIPFVLTPIVNVVISLSVIELGWVASPSVTVPFNSPLFLNAWIATNGDSSAILLQLFNIGVGTLIYIPAVRALNRAYTSKAIDFPVLDTIYMRWQEEARMLKEDTVISDRRNLKRMDEVESQLKKISHKEFYVEYQPQVSSLTEKVIGSEALIRAIDQNGKVESPAMFLPWLEEAKLMKDIDLFVFKQAVKDILEMRRNDVSAYVSVNITPETLLAPDYIKKILQIIAPVSNQIHIEITEESLLVDEHVLGEVFNQFKNLGVKISIDDFGTGYSSLSYVNKFDVDSIKIDRSFVNTLDTTKGIKLFNGLVSLAHELDLGVVVEGVETDFQLAQVPQNSETLVQGWYYSRALPLNEFIEYSHSLNKNLNIHESDE